MSVGALTTTFSAPPACTSSFSNIYGSSSGEWNYTVQGPISTDACFPPNYRDSRNNYYSPGFACPLGYTSACTSLNSIGALTETVVTCCPTSFTCNAETNWGWETTMGCSSTISGVRTKTVTIFSNGEPVQTTTTTFENGGFNAYSVQLRFQASDLKTESATPTDSTASSPASTASPPAATSGSSSGSSGGLSTGAKAGIGVGVTIGVLALAGMAWAFFLLGRRRQPTTKAENPGLGDPSLAMPKYAGRPMQPHQPSELDVPPQELDPNPHLVSEMDAAATTT